MFLSGLRDDTYGITGNPYYGWRGVGLRKERVEKINMGDFYPGSDRKRCVIP